APQPIAQLGLVRGPFATWTQVEPADELAARLLQRGPEAVAVVALVALEEVRQLFSLDLLARRCAAAGDVVHHLRVAVELDELVDVVRGESPQRQSLCLQEDLHQWNATA